MVEHGLSQCRLPLGGDGRFEEGMGRSGKVSYLLYGGQALASTDPKPADRFLADGLFMRSAADQLGARLVPVQGDQRAVQGAGGVVATRVDDHGLARPEAADP